MSSKDELIGIISRKHPAPGWRYLHFDNSSILEDVCYGLADIQKKIIVDKQTSFNAFSITKTFTAVSILNLQEKACLDINDSLNKHLSEYRFSSDIKIKHLLNHQSGFSNPIPLNWVHLKHEHNTFDSKAFFDEVIINKLKIKRKPGIRFAYSNINYLILGKLIERIADQDYESFVETIINNAIHYEPGVIGFKYPEQDHACGYHKNNFVQRALLGILIKKEGLISKSNKDWMRVNPFYLNGAAYGGIFCNPKSLMSFYQKLMPGNESLLSKRSRKYLFEDSLVRTDRKTGMSMGWFLGKLKGHDYICHAGGGVGYYAEVRIYPDLKKGSVIMLNSSGMNDKRLLDSIDSNYILT